MDIQNFASENTALKNLRNSLMFLHVNELRDLAAELELVDKGNKKTIVLRICHFFQTGKKLAMPKFPQMSCTERGKTYPLDVDGLMLKGAYKNDLKTRLFFKSLIGNHFHFTAFGIDWLNDRWMDGRPPTYGEFAKMWGDEYKKRKETPVSPKEEWAYINFVREFLVQSPDASHSTIIQSWKAEREKERAKAYQLIERLQS